MSSCSGCGIHISCPQGCGVFCASDCSDCTQWCEPTTVREDASSGERGQGTLIRIDRTAGETRIRVGSLADLPYSDSPRYSEQTELHVCLQDLPRASVARLFGYLLGRTVHTAAEGEDERISGSDRGTIAELVARYSLAIE